MITQTNIPGIHHITAVTASAAGNLAFYETTLGLRLVKQTVNFDDPYTYHLYYGDAQGTPGTILTFFPWENLPQGKPGAGMVTAIAFSVPEDSMDYWKRRLDSAGIQVDRAERFGEPILQFTDPFGLPLELLGTSRPPATKPWQTDDLSESRAITGFHSATATLNELEPVVHLLKDLMGMTANGQERNRYRFSMHDPEAAGHYFDVVIDPQARPGRPGSGTVHHIAFRTDNDTTQENWQTLLRKSGLGVTDVRDRKYFRSIYFHSPGGVLFEMATDPPGFGVDETPAELGSSLKLPAQYALMRSDIERRLPVLRPETFHHLFKAVSGNNDDGHTLVALHGTGGNEYDLIDLARQVSPSAAIISPRGQVLENGMPRFFKRLASNVFDERDIVQRARELSGFLAAAAPRYGRSTDRLTALGYSNGANMAAAMMLLHPGVFSKAVLIRPMQPLNSPATPDLSNKRVLVLKGVRDRVIPSESTDRLVRTLKVAGADVTAWEIDAGHEITADDIDAITRWFSNQQSCEPDCRDEAALKETV